jgi:hypothetical protein
MNDMFYYVNNIKRLENLNVHSLPSLNSSTIMGWDDKPKLRYFLCKGIGTQESQTAI